MTQEESKQLNDRLLVLETVTTKYDLTLNTLQENQKDIFQVLAKKYNKSDLVDKLSQLDKFEEMVNQLKVAKISNPEQKVADTDLILLQEQIKNQLSPDNIKKLISSEVAPLADAIKKAQLEITNGNAVLQTIGLELGRINNFVNEYRKKNLTDGHNSSGKDRGISNVEIASVTSSISALSSRIASLEMRLSSRN